MFRKISYLILAALLASACTENIEFNGEYDGEKLVLFCFPNNGEALVAKVYGSMFFLSPASNRIAESIRGAEVFAEINGERRGMAQKLTNDGADYVLDYIPKEGDRIKIGAKASGYREVWGETVVPKAPAFRINNPQIDPRTMELNFAVTVDDPAEEHNYYRLTLDDASERLFLYSSNVIFLGDDLAMEYEIPEYFSDERFDGLSYTFDVTSSPLWYYEQETSTGYTAGFSAVSEDLYKYAVSVMASNGTDDITSIFGEAVSIHNNIHDGIGCVGAYLLVQETFDAELGGLLE